MTSKEKTIKELKEALDSLDITNEYRLNLIRAIEYLQEEPISSTQKHEELLEKTATRLRSIADRTYHITSGNLSNELACLRGFALRAADIIDKSLNKD